jgi:hypothetical protein
MRLEVVLVEGAPREFMGDDFPTFQHREACCEEAKRPALLALRWCATSKSSQMRLVLPIELAGLWHVGGRWRRVASMPSWTHRCRTRFTVETLTSTASAITVSI